MSGAHYYALAGCLLSAFVVHDLIRGSAGFSSFTFKRALQPVRFWTSLGLTAWVAALAFIAALRMGEE